MNKLKKVKVRTPVEQKILGGFAPKYRDYKNIGVSEKDRRVWIFEKYCDKIKTVERVQFGFWALLLSLPVWATWIEIPCAGRFTAQSKSLPVWATWIEIISLKHNSCKNASLPVWATWIEI